MLAVPCQGYPALVILLLSVAGSTGKHAGPPDLRPAVWLEASSRSSSPRSLLAVLRCLFLETSEKDLEQSQEQTLLRKRGFIRVAGAG